MATARLRPALTAQLCTAHKPSACRDSTKLPHQLPHRSPHADARSSPRIEHAQTRDVHPCKCMRPSTARPTLSSTMTSTTLERLRWHSALLAGLSGLERAMLDPVPVPAPLPACAFHPPSFITSAPTNGPGSSRQAACGMHQPARATPPKRACNGRSHSKPRACERTLDLRFLGCSLTATTGTVPVRAALRMLGTVGGDAHASPPLPSTPRTQ